MDEANARWSDAEEQSAWLALLAVVMWLPPALDAQLQRDAGVSNFEYGVLAQLSMSPRREMRMSGLARGRTARWPGCRRWSTGSFGFAAHWVTGGRRDFTSVTAMVAERYTVQVDPAYLDEATRIADRIWPGRTRPSSPPVRIIRVDRLGGSRCGTERSGSGPHRISAVCGGPLRAPSAPVSRSPAVGGTPASAGVGRVGVGSAGTEAGAGEIVEVEFSGQDALAVA